ncbi:MAG: inositol monophosphatase family protein [Bacteroidota bacterium]
MKGPISTLQHLAIEAGRIMLSHRCRPVKIHRKPDGTPVTEVDLAISRLVCQRIRENFPDHCLLTEETHHDFVPKAKGFIVDELDGTQAFIRGRNGFAFQAAYFEEGDEIKAAVIYDPVRDMMLVAENGKGVRLNTTNKSTPISPMPVRRWEYLRFAHHRQRMTQTHQKLYRSLSLKAEQIVATGCVASKVFDFVLGRVDALVALNRYIAPWDWAPAKVILQELGYGLAHFNGRSLHLSDQPTMENFGYIVAPEVHLPRLTKEVSWITQKFSSRVSNPAAARSAS